MGEKYPRWTYVVIFALLVIVAVLSVRALRGQRTQTAAVPADQRAPSEEKAVQRDVESERRVEELNNELAGLRKQNEENSGRVKELEAKLAETSKALAAAQQKLKVAQRQPERPAPAPAPREKALASRPSPPAQAPPPSVQPAPRRVEESGAYEVVRDTAVLEKPSTSAREVALVQRGMTVNVVASIGDWLEVRSKYGKPPGYIRRQDVTPKQVRDDNNRDRF